MTKPTAILTLWKQAEEISREIRAVAEQHFNVVFFRYCDWETVLDQDYLASLKADYLISFSPVIIRKPLLDSIQIAAVNFHPAPPKYPGRGGVSYALFNGDSEFGATCHLMSEKIDDGPILDVECFPIDGNDTVESLQAKALAKIPVLARRWMETRCTTPNGMQWNGRAKTQRDFMAFMEVQDFGEMDRKIMACKHPIKPGPYVQVGRWRFWYIEGK